MDKSAQTTQHDWNYFLALDDDVARLSRYLDITEDNFNSYSLELARILFVAASEIDVIAKRLCQKLNLDSKAKCIEQYRKTILPKYPQIKGALVEMPRFGLVLDPWGQWDKNISPIWWTAYNKVKHHRNTHFFQASLENALNAIAGLFILLLFFYRDESENARLNPTPVLFQAGAPFVLDYSFYAPPATFYKLNDAKE